MAVEEDLGSDRFPKLGAQMEDGAGARGLACEHRNEPLYPARVLVPTPGHTDGGPTRTMVEIDYVGHILDAIDR